MYLSILLIYYLPFLSNLV